MEVEDTPYLITIDEQGSRWQVVMGVDHIPIQFKVDTGADFP